MLSPLFFIAYMDKVINEFKAGWDKDNEWGILEYADDIAFWSVVEEDMREGLERWNLCFERAGLKMNKEKTVFMRVNRERNRGNLDIQVEGRYLKEVEKFEYLGSVFGGAGGVEKDIAERIGKYGRSVNCFYPLLKNQNVPLQAKRVIFESILTPILTYGAECWTTTTVTRSRIQAAEMKPLRTMIGKSRRDRIRNEHIRERIGVSSIRNKIEKTQLRWLGHLERMEEGRVARRCWEWRPVGRRPRGRPKKRWKDEVEEVLERHRFPNITQLRREGQFADRDEWRRRLHQLTGR